MSNWIEDGHGNNWQRCKLGADCGLKVIEAGKARCWCQDQEASRVEVQVAREQIAKLEARIEQLECENASLRSAFDSAIVLCEHQCEPGKKQPYVGKGFLLDGEALLLMNRTAFDAAVKEAQP